MTGGRRREAIAVAAVYQQVGAAPARQRLDHTWPAPLGLVLVFSLVALPAAGIAALRGFDGLYGQDAYAYFDYSVGSVRQSVLHLAPLEPFFWPPGYPILVALASLLVGPTPLAGQAVSLVAGALVPVFTALLVRELWPAEPLPLAILAGLFVAMCGQLWQSSMVVMADTTGLVLATLSAWALARFARGHHAGWLVVVASAAIAYATLARWIYGLVALPFGIYALWALRQRRNALAPAAAAIAIAGAIVIPVLGAPLINLLSQPTQPAPFAGNFQVYSWSPLNAFRTDFQTPDGHLQYPLANGLYYATAPANPAFLGPVLALWLLLGLWSARRWPLPAALLVLGWAATVYAFHAGAPWQNFRFTLAYLPPVAILAAAGVNEAWRWSKSVGLRGAVRLRAAVVLCAAVGMLVAAGGAIRLVDTFIDRKNDELALVAWVQSQAPSQAQLFTFGPTLAFRHYSAIPTFDLFDLSQSELQSVLADPVAMYLLLDESSVEGQWLGQAPSTNFHALRDGRGLALVGTRGAYSLYHVQPHT